MRCVAIDVSGAVVDVVPQPADVASCTLVLASPTELVSAWSDLLTMSAADGALVSAAIAGCWVVGWVIGLAARIGTMAHD